MSECVVRMNIPKSCSVCPFMRTCERYKDWLDGKFEKIKPTCPGCKFICSLPEGHGRLVDADALKEWFIEQIDYYKRFDGPNCSMMVSAYEAICRLLNNIPTIVPAEAERSET